MSFSPKQILTMPATVEPVREVRSTLVAASMQALRTHGHFDRYFELLSPEWRERLLGTPAGVWLPLEWAEAHYAACDGLKLDEKQILGMGNAVAELTQKTAFALAARVVREAGADPITILNVCPRLWARIYNGGAVAALQTGPKDVRFETVAVSLARFSYWRTGYRGIMRALIQPLCRTIMARELSHRGDAVTLKLSWV